MTSHVKKKDLSSKRKAEVKQLDEEHTWTQNMGMTLLFPLFLLMCWVYFLVMNDPC